MVAAEKMIRCQRCAIPMTRPDTHFEEGVCSACHSAERRSRASWDKRRDDLMRLLKRHDMKCIVPSSGGKDSTWQVLTLLEMGADVTVVTASTCYLTEIGRHNIDNLARFARTFEVTPNRKVRAKLNRIGLEMVGDISWPEHASIFSTPFRMACALKIPLLIYGENPQAHYGGPPSSEEARQMTRRWTSEFGGFLGLRPSDLVGMEDITERDMQDYQLPPQEEMDALGVEAHFIGQYIQWDSHENARVSRMNGMKWKLPAPYCWWDFENQDNAMTGIHDYFGFLKYGYGRLAAQVSVDVRQKRMTRERAMDLIYHRDGLFPDRYMDVPIAHVLHRMGMSSKEFIDICNRFMNADLFCEERVEWGKKLTLREFA